MLGPPIDWGQQCPEHDVDRMDLEWQQLVINWLVETKACNDRTQVATSTDKCRHHRQLLFVHEWHNAVARALRHLHKEREANQDHQCRIPLLIVADTTKCKEEDGLEEEGNELCPDAASETKACEEEITENTTEGPCKKIHATEASRQRGGITRLHLEVSPEMCSQLVIHGKFGTKTCRVLKDHDHDPWVLEYFHIVPHRRTLSLSCNCCCEPLGSGCVPAQQLQAQCSDQECGTRDDHCDSPGLVSIHASIFEGVEEDDNHEDLRHTTAQVPPASSSGICCAHNVGGKHEGTPELIRHKRSTSSTNEETNQSVVPWGSDATRRKDPDGSKGQQ
mmetsp:Transcript_45255/g.78779  ORF Transcript_45255/g.78779 Transcript_45255/m.78779 type:complete len:334 (+) Transcript_45255:356-1357(+)